MIVLAATLLLAADFRFAIAGDNTGRAKPGVFEAVWKEIDRFHPAFTLSAGDAIEGGKDETAAAEWDALRPVFERIGATGYPRLFAAGNHDIWSPKSQAAFEKFTGRPVSFGFDYEDIHITVLDNSRSEYLSDAQLEFLEKDLAANQGKALRFVCFHKPFWLIPLKLQNLQNPFHQMMKKYKVHSVFSGHVHQLHRMVREGIVYWSVPSAGGDLRGNSSFERGWFYGYIAAEVRSGKGQQQAPSFTIHQLAAPFGEGKVLAAESWGENGPVAAHQQATK